MANTAVSAGKNSALQRNSISERANARVSEKDVPEISASGSDAMSRSDSKRRVLIIVENQTVPFDPRVWREACSLRENGYEVAVLCPRRKGFTKGYEVIEGVHVYRHPSPPEGSTPMGYLWEYGCA